MLVYTLTSVRENVGGIEMVYGDRDVPVPREWGRIARRKTIETRVRENSRTEISLIVMVVE